MKTEVALTDAEIEPGEKRGDHDVGTSSIANPILFRGEEGIADGVDYTHDEPKDTDER